jgi:4-amino-4-deoxy-L-arabinose transferase-like glycosyltransferase
LCLLIVVVLAGLAIRLYSLGTFPDTLLADEADNAQDAVSNIFGRGPENGFFGLDWTAQPAFSSYLMSAFIYVLGPSVEAIRWPSALISALTLVPLYILLRRQLSLLASLLGTVLLASNVWFLNFSRSGWNNVHVCFYMLMAMLFLMLALDTLRVEHLSRWRRWLYFGGAGAFCALGLYSYPSGRAIILGILAFFVVALWFYRRHKKDLVLGYLMIGVVAALLFAPQGAYIARNWEWFNGRSSVVALVNSPAYQANPVGTIWQQVTRNVRGPWDGSVNNTPQYTPVGEPQIETATGVLVLAGMVLSLGTPSLRRRPETWLWWIMLLVAWIATQVMTGGTPNGARGIGYMPTLIYFAAIALEIPIRLSQKIPRAVPLVSVGVTAFVMIVSVGNVRHYVEWQSDPGTRQARYLYITVSEFPRWMGDVVERARSGQGKINVGQWREAYPIKDLKNPEPIFENTPTPPP